MTGKKAWVLAILAIFSLSACATTQRAVKGASLPNDIHIIAPSPDLRKDIAAFSGKWVGTLESGMEIILVVAEIHDTWAQVFYSWGDNPQNSSMEAGHTHLRCKVISDPEPTIEYSGQQWEFNFVMKDLNTLGARGTFSWWRGGGADKQTSNFESSLKRAN